MNTDNNDIPMARLEALGAAESREAFTDTMEAISRCLGMDHYVVLRVAGTVEQRAIQLMHNASTEAEPFVEDVSRLCAWAPVAQVRRTGLPVILNADDADGVWLPGFRHGVALTRTLPRGIMLMLFGRAEKPVQPESAMRLQAMSVLAASHATISLMRLHEQACPFSERELECLRYAMAGHRAKETARMLGVSFRTVEEYLSRARERVKLTSTVAVAMYALDSNWITFEQVNTLAA